jgi:3-isopropylmalate/(R)-2-methylmalate dehydratase large subunit
MGMTMAEKILAAHADQDSVAPGAFVLASTDLTMANDITAPLSIRAFAEAGGKRVHRPDSITLVMDHFTPNKDIASAEHVRITREFAEQQKIPLYYESAGIAHTLLPDRRLVRPGDLVLGADSHTCTYGALGAFATGMGSTDIAAAWLTGKVWLRVPESIKLNYRGSLKPWVTGKDLILFTIGDLGADGASYRVMEFDGDVIRQLSMPERFTMTNMAVEAGAKTGLMAVDDKTLDFLGEPGSASSRAWASDPDASYCLVRDYDVTDLDPQVAVPSSPGHVKPVQEVSGTPLDQVVIGSCTNGRLEDLQVAARILKGKTVPKHLRLIIIPATRAIYRDALRQGLFETFLDAGAVISPPTCGPCLGGHMGILAKGERCLSTTNRNFKGRMGHPESEVYLASPAVAAASAITGEIAHPAAVAKEMDSGSSSQPRRAGAFRPTSQATRGTRLLESV